SRVIDVYCAIWGCNACRPRSAASTCALTAPDFAVTRALALILPELLTPESSVRSSVSSGEVLKPATWTFNGSSTRAAAGLIWRSSADTLTAAIAMSGTDTVQAGVLAPVLVGGVATAGAAAGGGAPAC